LRREDLWRQAAIEVGVRTLSDIPSRFLAGKGTFFDASSLIRGEIPRAYLGQLKIKRCMPCLAQAMS